ncbi:hypothetical protein DES53_102266 [Roseimicrobium gellanilyticum]|uniref:Uncharacterized protein n=1 Tax=Roseimicrobium gellanilyticum TaxID=748857 RepID=A0A366HQF3_9BACT|nr:hypothetical protein [Roseimicrobium gellanilyticum]RBP45882.1 hypothetical protein DES53_102266 [Roseimicrobium gellanilyticum]
MKTLRSPFPRLATALVSTLFACALQAQTLPDKPVVSGTFLGDGKDGKIQYLVVQTREPFSDQPAIRLVFTEKDPSSSKKPDFDAAFKKLGSALVISVHKDGGIFGCDVVHTAHSKSPFSSIGKIKMKEFKVTETHASGTLSTGGTQEFFDQKWDVELTFSAPLPKGAFAATEEEPKPAATPASSSKKMAQEGDNEKPAASTGPQLPVAQLPLPAAARDVEYKKVVGHITFRSDESVSAVATDFSKKLKQQGWKDQPGSLIGKTNAIIKRKLNGADLTIMIQPEGKGCTAKVFTQGLDWSSPPSSTSGTPASQPTKGSEVKDVEDEANKLLNDALKKIPGGLK